MNRFLYTVLITAVSVGITLAFVAGCSKKCVCADEISGTEGDGTQQTGEDEFTEESTFNTGSGTGSETQSNKKTAGKIKTSERTTGTAEKTPPTKYGDAETGGNVYTRGGIEPAAGSPGSPGNTDTTKTPRAKLRPAKTTGLKTAADGQRN